MRQLRGLLVLVLVLGGCGGMVMESAALPLPAVQPAPPVSLPLPLNLPPVALDTLPPLTVPLPGVHDAVIPRSHATERHASAGEARRAMMDGDNDCQFYLCSVSEHVNNLLRLCTIQGQVERLAVQWLHYDDDVGGWVEGTSYTRRWRGLENWLRNQGCRPAS